jgi:CelD/BcsL family acetyltransferase involved in cellulose biosynthesis
LRVPAAEDRLFLAMSNYFSTLDFLSAAAEAYYPGQPMSVLTVEVLGRCFEVLGINGRPVVDVPFLDFFEPSGKPSANGRAQHLPRVCHERLTFAEWSAAARPGFVAAPTTEWASFPSFEAFAAMAEGRSSRAFATPRRKERKLEREVGPVRFRFHDPDAALLPRCFAWKSAQYQRSGYVDMFAGEKPRRFFELLLARGQLVVSTLTAGERLLAVHLGVLHDKRFYSWVPSYDIDMQQYSPGAILFEKLLAHSYGEGHAEFDFLLGGEEYKFYYATHVRRIGPLGVPSARSRVWAAVRPRVMTLVRRQAGIYRALQALKRRLLQRRLS